MEYKTVIEIADEIIQHRDGEKFHHKKVFSDNKIYIYQVNNNWFEVFKKTIRPKASYIDGKFIKIEGVGRSVYPSDNNFGSWAWHCHDKSVIKTILNGLYDEDEIDNILSTFDDSPYKAK